MKWTLDFILKATAGSLAKSLTTAQKDLKFSAVGTDTREDLTGKVFFALKGDQFDAHQFLQQAIAANAAAIVIHDENALDKLSKEQHNKAPIIIVKDTLKALQDFSKAYRKTLKGKVIGITGSNGKTTTKEFCAQLLATKFKVHYSKGSFNNHWGVPLTLLAADPQHEILVVEMGMNHAGEIQQLVDIADPDIVMCTVVGRAHIEHFGSEEKIAEAKAEIYKYSRKNTVGIFNLDNSHTEKMASQYKKVKNLTFSMLKPADVTLKIMQAKFGEMKIGGQIAGQENTASVAVFGEQNVTNLMAAACVGLAVEMKPEEIWKGLSVCETSWGRNQILKAKNGATIIFDGYNANPDSMNALLDNRKLMSGSVVAVFGEMRELGEKAAEYHYELGVKCAKSQFELTWFYGPHFADFERGVKSVSSKENVIVSDTYKEDLALRVAGMLQPQHTVVCKASRGMKIERFVEVLHPSTLTGKVFSSHY